MLDELVKDHIDFLPLLSDTITDRRLYILHPITELDCLDSERSEFSRLSSGYIMGIKRHKFKPDCVGDVPIFKLPGNPGTRPYVNDKFKQLIEDYNLTGLEFRRCGKAKSRCGTFCLEIEGRLVICGMMFNFTSRSTQRR